MSKTSGFRPSAQDVVPGDDFGFQLRLLRTAKGWSLAELGGVAKISKQHLSSLELGRRRASASVAAACDQALDAAGALADLAAPGVRSAVAAGPRGELGEQERTQLLEVHGSLLRGLRRLAQISHPDATLPLLQAGARTLADAAARGPEGEAVALWSLAARYAEFTGWMFQESGRPASTLQWTTRAAVWAARAEDLDMPCYAWERRALILLYQGDATGTVQAARRAAAAPGASARVRALAARREAQGHALGGAGEDCRRALERAAQLLADAPAPYPRGQSWGPNSISDSSRLVEGWCLTDLGRHEQAAELLAADLALVPDSCAATRARFTVRLALTRARLGDVDGACTAVAPALPDLVRIRSATIRADARLLLRTLGERGPRPPAADLLPRLAAALDVH